MSRSISSTDGPATAAATRRQKGKAAVLRRATAISHSPGRARMIARFSMHESIPDWALAYEFDIYLRGPGQTPFEEAH